MRNLIITTLLGFISLFCFSTLAQPTSPTCLTYSRIANFSTIGANNTYRSAFLQASPYGTFQTGNMLNLAMSQLPPLTINAALNQECGNLTTVALTEAERNFTRGLVGGFEGVSANPTEMFAGWELIPMFGLIGLVFYGIWANA